MITRKNSEEGNLCQHPSQTPLPRGSAIKIVCLITNLCKHNKTILMILLWQCANNLTYYLLLEPSFIMQNLNQDVAIVIICLEAILSLFSPLAGILADVIYGRFQVLQWSTYVMVAFEFLTLVIWVVISAAASKIDFTFFLRTSLGIALLGYYFGRVFFVTNIIQFGTDQLRDSPTKHSVTYINIFFWSCSLSHLLSQVFSSLPYQKFKLEILQFVPTEVILLEVGLSISAIFSTIMLFIVQRYSSHFLTEKIRESPYKLVFNVIRFAIKHKKPIRRSAFTYCDDERPSRIDYGKQIYGGPFTTEQVEDVKSLLNIAKVLISLGPAFLLNLTGITIFRHYRHGKGYFNENPYKIIWLEKDFLSPLVIIICLPCFIFVIKPYFSRFLPNLLKRMGLSMLTLNILFVLYLAFSSIARSTSRYALGDSCPNSSIHVVHMDLVDLPDVCMPILLHILSSLHQMLLYIAAWEFICCQSPQHMKGLLFGLFYSIQAIFQLLSAVLSYTFFLIFTCQSVYFVLILGIGLISLLIFTVVSRRYKYRKRDDICNIYQYAENYYSNIQ